MFGGNGEIIQAWNGPEFGSTARTDKIPPTFQSDATDKTHTASCAGSTCIA